MDEDGKKVERRDGEEEGKAEAWAREGVFVAVVFRRSDNLNVRACVWCSSLCAASPCGVRAGWRETVNGNEIGGEVEVSPPSIISSFCTARSVCVRLGREERPRRTGPREPHTNSSSARTGRAHIAMVGVRGRVGARGRAQAHSHRRGRSVFPLSPTWTALARMHATPRWDARPALRLHLASQDAPRARVVST